MHTLKAATNDGKALAASKLQNIKPDKAIEITEFFNTPEDNPLHTIIKNLRIPISRQRTPDFLTVVARSSAS